MGSDLKTIIKNHMTYGVRPDLEKPSLSTVDALADELVREYNNAISRRWYCGVINKYGVTKVSEWRRRAAEGKMPGRLFTAYVNQAGGYRRSYNDK